MLAPDVVEDRPAARRGVSDQGAAVAGLWSCCPPPRTLGPVGDGHSTASRARLRPEDAGLGARTHRTSAAPPRPDAVAGPSATPDCPSPPRPPDLLSPPALGPRGGSVRAIRPDTAARAGRDLRPPRVGRWTGVGRRPRAHAGPLGIFRRWRDDRTRGRTPAGTAATTAAQ